jgi:O-antigen/teichoic acid export membrane protein
MNPISDEVSARSRANLKNSNTALIFTVMLTILVATQVIFLSRALGAEQRGLMVFLITVSNFSAILFSFGYGIAKSKESFKKIDLGALFSLNFLTAGSSMFIYSLIVYFRDFSNSLFYYAFIFVVSLANSALFILSDLLINSNKFHKSRAIILATVSCEFAISVTLYKFDNLTLYTCLVLNLVFTVIGFLLILTLIRCQVTFQFPPKIRMLFQNWKALIPFISTFQLVFFYRFPASFVIDLKELATLSVSISFVLIGSPIISYGSQFFRTKSAQGGLFKKESTILFTLIMIILICISVIQYLLADKFVTYFLGSEFLDCIQEIRALSFSGPLFAVFVFAISSMQGFDDTRTNTFAILSLLGCMSVILIFGSIYGSIGICYGLIFFLFVQAISSMVYLWRFAPKVYETKS